MLGRCSAAACRWAAALAWGLAAAVQAAPPSVADFARRPEVSQVTVSPSAARAALLLRAPNGRHALATVDLARGGAPQIVAAYDDVDVVRVSWVNDRRLVYQVQQPGYRVEYEMWGTFAVDHDGADPRHLITARSDTEAATGSRIRYQVLTRDWTFWKPVGDDSDDVYVKRWGDTAKRGWQVQAIARVDTRSVRPRIVSEGQPANADGWLFDAAGRLAVVTTNDDEDRQGLWWQPAAGEPWKAVHQWRRYDAGALSIEALEGDGTLIVSAAIAGDTTALHAFDLRRGEIDRAPLVGVAGYDVERVRFDTRQQRVIGVPLDAQQPVTVWFDEGLARVQAAVDKALPAGRSNTLICGRCVGSTRYVVHSTGDRQPGEYFLYDPASARLTPFARSRPWIDEATQGRRTYHRVTARDGLSLPVVVTHPRSHPAGQPAPTVMLVHGGPWAEGAMLNWEAEPQVLASLGYRVLQVSFRGTTGLGWQHFRASWGAYGLSMQDDLDDALQWAIREKHTDPDRVCIYGASYGGYAALMGPVRHPGRYRCAVSHVGVTDLTLLYSGNWTDITPAGRQHGLGRLIGDPERDAERLRRQSPVNRVAEIKVPVLIAQGRHDRRVSPEHADRFVSAARAAGVSVERVDYEEGHGFASEDSLADFWQRLGVFLGRHLGPR
jgi:dipeptidyl aminopeptidase/acylaminoacyl peptidase